MHAGTAQGTRRAQRRHGESSRSAERPELARLNLKWHRRIRGAAANTYLDRFLGQVENAVRRLSLSTFEQPNRAAEVLAEHDAILRAIASKDGAAAEAAAKAHMRRARQVRLAVLVGDS